MGGASPLRVRALFLALVVVLVALVAPSAPARGYTFPQFGDSIHDYGVDLDGDGLYDELRVDFTATVLENLTASRTAITLVSSELVRRTGMCVPLETYHKWLRWPH